MSITNSYPVHVSAPVRLETTTLSTSSPVPETASRPSGVLAWIRGAVGRLLAPFSRTGRPYRCTHLPSEFDAWVGDRQDSARASSSASWASEFDRWGR